jgi:tetratricopeptide (TPR) repeat protein
VARPDWRPKGKLFLGQMYNRLAFCEYNQGKRDKANGHYLQAVNILKQCHDDFELSAALVNWSSVLAIYYAYRKDF